MESTGIAAGGTIATVLEAVVCLSLFIRVHVWAAWGASMCVGGARNLYGNEERYRTMVLPTLQQHN